MIGPVLQRYGFDLVLEPERLRNLVEHQCRKQNQPLPSEETWLPVNERWLTGWPQRGSLTYLDRYRTLRSGLLRALGGGGLEPWLEQLPATTVMPSPRSEVEVGRGPGQQRSMQEGLVRLGWGGRLVLDGSDLIMPATLSEGELHILGGTDDPAPLELGKSVWSKGWLRLENLVLTGELRLEGGLVELHRCFAQPGSSLIVVGAGAVLALEESDIYGHLEVQPCALLHALNTTFEGGTIGVDSAGLARLQGVAFSQHVQAAVRLTGTSRSVIEDCQLRDSGQGLVAAGQSRAWLTQSWFRANRNCGLVAEDRTELEIQSCQFRNNNRDGLFLRDQARVHLRLCTIQENQAAGVRITDRVTLERASNHVTANPEGDWLEGR